MIPKIDLNLLTLSDKSLWGVENLKEIPSSTGSSTKKISKNKINGFKSVNILTYADLIRYFPRRYIERSKIMSIKEISQSDVKGEVTFTGVVTDISVFTTRTRLRITTFKISDDTGTVSAKWFGPQYIERRFSKEDRVFITGKPEVKKNGSVEVKNAYIEINDYDFEKDNVSFVPIYRKIPNNSPNWTRKKLNQIFQNTNDYDPMPAKLRSKYKIAHRTSALKNIHFPKSSEEVSKARRRLVIDEFMYLQSFFHKVKEINKNSQSGVSFIHNEKNLTLLIKDIGFKLTNAQTRVIGEIKEDMESSVPMKRLLQGDVGSGKTVVATYALITAVQSGYQAALMAPTEVLAEQHYKNIKEMCKNFTFDIYLITSAKKDKSRIQSIIEEGSPALFIGTHALIQEKIRFNNLGLAIIDEQHRFGVEQRSKLTDVGTSNTPDLIIMTATPIPRTTALTVYGDLDLSILDEHPSGRKEITTYYYDGLKETQEKIFNHCDEHLKKNSQIFLVCPFIEESEKMDIRAAQSVYEIYKEKFSNSNVELLHGKMESSQKESIMRDLHTGKIDILVSTVVIEVGIDVANATLMIIESAERFGLSQIHQLRGRVGRGSKKSECILHLSEKKKLDTVTIEGKSRIEAAMNTSDGFEIADLDLKIRGEGKVLGKDQSGVSELKIADIKKDLDLLITAKDIFEDKEASSKFKNRIFDEALVFLPHYKEILFG